MDVWYTTREDVKSALETAAAVRSDVKIAQVIASASRAVDSLCHRTFSPWTGTKLFDWPGLNVGSTYRLWLNQHEIISAEEITSGGVVISDYFLEPSASGPPYSRVDLNRDEGGTFLSEQRSVAITGVFGYDINEEELALTVSNPFSSSATTLDVSGPVDVGRLLRLGSERMQVIDKTWLTTGQTLQATMAASVAANTVAVTDGTAFYANEIILIDAERMLVTDVAGNNLVVKRAVEGSTLAAHTTGTVYVPRRLHVARGVLGTTAAAHTVGTVVVGHVFPALVRELALAYALNDLEQRSSGYARVVGAGENQREASGRGIRALEEDVYAALGRKGRVRAA